MLCRREASMAAGLASVLGWRAGGARAITIKEGNVCIDCGGEGINPCPRCKGTAKMTMLFDETKTVDCTECKAAGYKLCGKCYATGLPKAQLKPLLRDQELRTSLARLTFERMDTEGRRRVREGVAAALAEARRRREAELAA